MIYYNRCQGRNPTNGRKAMFRGNKYLMKEGDM
jgi:hypothetical protein